MSQSTVDIPNGSQAPRDESLLKRVLVVDDEETIRLALARFLRSRGFIVEAVASADAALDAMARGRFALMLCDVRMPGMSGLELVPRALGNDPDLAIMMLSAVNDAPTAAEALSSGALDYLLKPIELNDLCDAAERALRKRTLLQDQRRVELIVRDEVAQRTSELEHEKATLRELTMNVAHALINAMEAKDPYLRGRSQRVAALAASVADALALNEDMVEAVRMAGRLADVGMIGLHESVLHKPSALTPEEYKHVKEHVRIGMEILAPLKHLGTVLTFVQDHHEHLDGTGYPRALVGNAISVGGRILAAADAYDALTSRRAYREPLSPSETVAHMQQFAGTHFDPQVFDALRSVVARRKSLVFIDELHGS